MGVRKFTISLDEGLHEAVSSRAAASGTSVSQWLAEAAQRQLRRQEGLAAVREYEAEFGAFTDEERAWADAILDRLGYPSPAGGDRP
jgi:hypothetical protein